MFDFFSLYFWIIVIVYGIIFGIASSYLAGQKNKDKGTWFFIGFFLGIIGLILIAASKTEGKSANELLLDSPNTVRNYVDASKKILSPIKYINLDAPVEIREVKIKLEDVTNRVYLAVEFGNLSTKTVLGVKFTAYCYDSFGDTVARTPENGLNLVMQDISAGPKSIFGGTNYYPIFEYPNTRLVDIVINLVSFVDGTTWKRGDNEFRENHLIPINNRDDLNNLRKIAGNDAITYPSEDIDTWLCVCGRLNYVIDHNCRRCTRSKEVVLTKYNKLIIQKETIRLEEIKNNELKASRRKMKRVLFISMTIFAVIMSSSILISRYQKQKALETELALKAQKDAEVQQQIIELIASLKKQDSKAVDSNINGIPDANYKDSKGNYVLHIAISKGLDYEIYEMLVNLGADINAKNSIGNTPLHSAVSTVGTSNDKLLTLLLDNGADVNAKNSKGQTALHIALMNSKASEIMEILFQYDANPNLKDNSGQTPLYKACFSNGSYDLIEILLMNGADPNNVDNYSKTLIGQLREYLNFSFPISLDIPKTIELLESYGAR